MQNAWLFCLTKYLLFQSCGLDGCNCTYPIVQSLCIFFLPLKLFLVVLYISLTLLLLVYFFKADL